MSTPRSASPRRTSLGGWGRVALVGLALVVLYHLLAGFEVGKVGQPADIGGGLILVSGYVVTLVGVAGALAAWVSARRRRP